MPNKANNIIVALDGMDLEEVKYFLKKTEGRISYIKVGMELYYRYGKRLMNELPLGSVKLFLDLKLHDIPKTVEKAIQSLQEIPVHFLTVHLHGGVHMLTHAKKAAEKYLPNSKVLGVTYLTSLGNQDFETIFDISNQDLFAKRFNSLLSIAKESRIDGLISSPKELSIIKSFEKKHDHTFLKVCPGIRFQDEIENGNTQDQIRVLPPEEAFSRGADYLVIGRSLTQTQILDQRLEELNNI